MKKSLGAKTLAFPAPVWVVGSYDKDGKPNAMVAAWGGICCSRPPMVSVSLRAATYSHAGIMARRAFTISIPSEAHASEADYLGIASGRDTDKFTRSGLTPKRAENVDAPYVEEFPVVIECRVAHVNELGMHTQFIGEIVDVRADESVLDAEGRPDIEKIRPLIYCTGTSNYHGVGPGLGKAFSIGKKYIESLA